ncbi:MAG: hypothetical protein R2865_06355 [Deinococcales bacterium]
MRLVLPWQRSSFKQQIAINLLLLGLTGFMLAGVAGLNYRYYGIFTLNERQSSLFGGVGAFYRLKGQSYDVPVPFEVRERLYELSPTLAALREWLERPVWRGQLCKIPLAGGNKSALDCSEIQGGWFNWALRDAVARAGHYQNIQQSQATYLTISQEINQACQKGLLDCYPPRSSEFPHLKPQDYPRVLKRSLDMFIMMLRLEGWDISQGESSGPKENALLFDELTQGPFRRLDPSLSYGLSVSGWIYLPEGSDYELQVLSGDGVVPSQISRPNSPDIVQRFQDPNQARARFSLEAPCDLSCRLLIQGQSFQGEIALADLAQTKDLMLAEKGQLHIKDLTMNQNITQLFAAQANTINPRWQDNFWTSLAKILRQILPWLTLVALLLFVLNTFIQKRLIMLDVIALALLGGVFARILGLAYIDVISFPAANLLYLSPNYPLLMGFIVISFRGIGNIFSLREEQIKV